jgi:hypothetical protein
MSENPYAPPGADLGVAHSEHVGGRGDFEIGQCLNDAWANTWANFPLWLLVGIVFLAVAALGVISLIGIVMVLPVLTWGVAYFGLRMHDGRAEFGDLFAGFSQYATALAGMLGCILLIMLIGALGQSVQVAGQLTGGGWLMAFGAFINLVVTLFVTPRLTFAYFFVVEGESPMDALSRSWEVTSASKWKIVALALIGPLIGIAGLLLLVVGVIPAMAIVSLMWVSAYRQTVGVGAAG